AHDDPPPHLQLQPPAGRRRPAGPSARARPAVAGRIRQRRRARLRPPPLCIPARGSHHHAPVRTRMNFTKIARDERGLAVPIALAILFMVAALATISVKEAVVSQSQSYRDRNVKRALQAAAAGLETAVYDANLMQPGSLECVIHSATTGQLVS